jgi:predicted transport protein
VQADPAAPAKHAELNKYTQQRYGLTYGYANVIALKVREAAALSDASSARPTDPADSIDAHYTGAKAALRPIYERLAAEVRAFGSDVEFSPKKTYVSLRRKKQFGCINPATNTRVDVGLNLKGVEPVGRLEKASDAMFTHRVRVSRVEEVDTELVGLLRRAYEQAG